MNEPRKRQILHQIAAIPTMERGRLSAYSFKDRSGLAGPYHKLQHWQDGKNHTRYIPVDELAPVQAPERAREAASMEASLVDTREKVTGDSDPQCSSCLEVDDQLKLGDSHDWEIGRLRALQDLVDVAGRASPEVVSVRCPGVADPVEARAQVVHPLDPCRFAADFTRCKGAQGRAEIGGPVSPPAPLPAGSRPISSLIGSTKQAASCPSGVPAPVTEPRASGVARVPGPAAAADARLASPGG